MRVRAVVGARLDGHDALADRGQEFVDREDAGGGVGQAQTLEAGERQQRGIDHALVELAQAGLHIAADGNDLEIRPQPQHDRLPPQRRGPDHRAGAQFGKRPGGRG